MSNTNWPNKIIGLSLVWSSRGCADGSIKTRCASAEEQQAAWDALVAADVPALRLFRFCEEIQADVFEIYAPGAP